MGEFRPGAAVRVTTPASSANLGPGFDALGLALTLSNRVDLEVVESGVGVTVTGAGARDLPADESHLVVRAASRTFEVLDVEVPGLRVRCDNGIPIGRGLGSSAAAIVAGVSGAYALAHGRVDRSDTSQVLTLAARLEGHPDNVAACLLGGLTVAWSEGDRTSAIKVDVDVSVALFVSPAPGATARARAVLPDQVAHSDAARAVGRAALLVAALTRPYADLATLYAATDDRLHQPYRAAVMPASMALVDRLRGSGIPAVLSGAGPSVLALLPRHVDVDLEASLAVHRPPGWHLMLLPVDAGGTRVQSEILNRECRGRPSR